MEQKTDINELREKYPSFFEAFSFRLIDFVVNGTMAKKIANICIENKILEQEKIEKISYWITYVVFEKMKKEDLVSQLENEVQINKETALRIYKSVDEIVFAHVSKIATEEVEEAERLREEKAKEERERKQPTPPPVKDSYREPIE